MSKYQNTDVWNEKEGYVYRNGERFCKIVRSMDGNAHIKQCWHPQLDRLADIEALYFKLRDKYISHFKEMMDYAFSHDPDGKGDFVIKFRTQDSDCFVRVSGDPRGYSLNWQIPIYWAKLPVIELPGFQTYYEYSLSVARRKTVVYTYLHEAIERKLYSLSQVVGHYCFAINGRHYWYYLVTKKYGAKAWEAFSWPDQHTNFVTLA
jgi:hypothetical protein